MAKILISGGSGLVGRAVTRLLLEEGHEVRWLSRKEGAWNGVKKFFWEPVAGIADEKAFEGINHIIHLAGAGIFDKRWTPRYKKLIVESRIRSAELLYKEIRKKNIALDSFTGASAVGYYGALTGGGPRSEDEKPGQDFLARVCVAWENSYAPFRQEGVRTNIIRTAVVLDKEEGALARLVTPFRFGLGAPLGNGRQAFPWIHTNDLARIYVRSVCEPSLCGVYNAAATEQLNNRQFTSTLAKTLHKPFWLPPIPKVFLRVLLGEAASALITGVNVSNRKLIESGFEFDFPELEPALKHLLTR
jgi:uncharacterized protein (TIGR01777 family)